MFAVTVEFRITPEHVAAFLDLIRANAANSRRDEPGCLQFDVCRDTSDPTLCFLYEIYASPEAFALHQTMPHFLDFDAATRDMVTSKTVKTFGEVWQ